MNKDTRIQKISEITAREPYQKMDVFWHNQLQQMPVYEVPLECLIYNKYNGRILSRTKTLERQGRAINPETDAGKEIIENLLWNSKKERNNNTKRDISEKGQRQIGIVTKDGIVIDGNRRLMLLNKLKPQYSHFKAVVLPVTLEDDPIEIEKLETIYQMGEDEKLSYNPIEKYLKAKQIYMKLKDQNTPEDSIELIAKWMGEEKSIIEDWLEVVKIIDDYLEYLRYEGIYAMADTPNDGKEDLFLYVKKWINTFQGKDSNKGFDGYQQMDVDDLKQICFDYIRVKIGKSYDGKMFRNIADGQKKNHYFGDKKIWTSFSEKHFEIVAPAKDKIDTEYPIDYTSDNIEASLSDRDEKFRNEVCNALIDNLKKHETSVDHAKAAEKPSELVDDAREAIESIDQKHKSFSSTEVMDKIQELIEKLMDMIKAKSPEHTIALAARLLQTIKIDPGTFDKEATLSKVKEVEKIAYQIEKNIKSLQ